MDMICQCNVNKLCLYNYCAVEERITVSREQLKKIQEIYDHAGIDGSTVPNPERGSLQNVSNVEDLTGDSCLLEIEINMDDGSSYCNSEDLFPEGIPPSYNHSGINYDKGKPSMLLIGHFNSYMNI